MPLKPIPDHGLELPLGEYSKLKAFQGGGWYWDHHHQQTICQSLGEFLPRVEERDGGALFQHFVHGREAAARSRPVAAGGDRVPKGELQRLQRALETLKRKADDPGTDRDAKRIIESFALPDPAKDPELYRLHGPPWRRRLLVLWGCEREAGSSVTPFAALGRVPVEPTSTTWLRRWPLLLGALLLLLLLLLLADMFWPKRTPEQITGDPSRPGVPETSAAPNSASPGGVTNGPLPLPAAAPTASPSSGLAARTGPSATVLPASGSGVPTSSNGPSPVAGAPSANGSTATPDRGANPAAVPPSASSGTPVPNPGAPGLASPASSPDATASRRSPSSSPTTPGLPAAGGSSPKPSAGGPRPEPSAASPGSTPSPARSAASPSDPATAGNSPANTAKPSPPAPSPAATPSTDPTSAPTPAGSPPPASPAPNAAFPPPTVSITARSSPAPKGGKVDVLLTATAVGEDGKPSPLTVTGWRIDGNPPPNNLARRAAEPGQLSLNLPEGVHTVRVTGTSNGTPVETEVKVNVQIRSQSDVRVEPGASR